MGHERTLIVQKDCYSENDSSVMYMYFFAVVYSFRRKIGDVRQEEEEEMKRKEKKRSSSKKSKRLFHHNHDLPFGESRQDYL